MTFNKKYMNNIIVGGIVGATVLGGGLLISNVGASYEEDVKKVDDSTISLMTPSVVKVSVLKEKLAQTQILKNTIQTRCNEDTTNVNAEIDAIRELILKAKNVGVK
jgi:ornithine cyclodeaminase/alanine dehydrogenase-like protein (mu-crystallin family)